MNKGMTLPEFEASVREQIANRNAKLEAIILGKIPPEEDAGLNKIFRFHTKIVTHEGDVISAQDSENYWRRLHKEGATDFALNEEWFMATILKDPRKCRPEEVDFVSFEITEFKFKINGQEFKGFIDPINKHRLRCTKDP